MPAAPPAATGLIPVHILTGFLGSGKTTLLRRLLADPALQDTAVVINEFGEVGLDHLLVRQVAEDVVLLGSGCLCCTVRDDLVSTLANLSALAAAGEIPRFGRMAIETTGLADPMPIAQAVLSERRLTPHYHLGRVITTVDAVCGGSTLEAHATAALQVAVADRIVLTKTDLAETSELQKLERQIIALGTSAQMLHSAPAGMPTADDLFGSAAAGRILPHAGGPPGEAAERHRHDSRAPAHDHGIATFTVTFDEAVRWQDFVEWLELLLIARGTSILRVKGLLSVQGHDGPRVIQGVQHVLHPPEDLQAWPDQQARSFLVFIARDLTQSSIERSLREVLGVRPLGTDRAAPARPRAQLPLS